MSGANSSTYKMSLLENVALAAHYLDSNIFVKESLKELVELQNVPLEMYVRLEVKKYVSKYNTYESRVILERINKLEISEMKRKNEAMRKSEKRPIASSSSDGEPKSKKVALQSVSVHHRTAPMKFEAKQKAVTAQAPPKALPALKPVSCASSSTDGEPKCKKVSMQSESVHHRTAPIKFEAKQKAVTAQAPPKALVALKPLERTFKKRRPDPLRRAFEEEKMKERERARREEKENQKKEGERKAAQVMADIKRCRELRIKEAQERKHNCRN